MPIRRRIEKGTIYWDQNQARPPHATRAAWAGPGPPADQELLDSVESRGGAREGERGKSGWGRGNQVTAAVHTSWGKECLATRMEREIRSILRAYE